MEKEENVARLIESLKEDDEHVRVQVLELLEEIGSPAVEQLIEALSSGEKNIRIGSAKALGEIKDPRAITPLIETLKDDNKWVRREASGALSKMGESAVDPLLGILDDADWKVRGAAAWALGSIGDKRAIEPLKKALDDKSGYVKKVAAEKLKNLE